MLGRRCHGESNTTSHFAGDRLYGMVPLHMVPQKRRLLRVVFPRRIRALDLANANADFERFLADVVGGAPRYLHREQLYDDVLAHLPEELPIDFVEFGVWKGATFRAWLERIKGEQHRFYGFDSFQGLPEDWRSNRPKGSFDVNGRVPEIADPRATIVSGLFQETLEEFLRKYDRRGRRLVVHLDADLYSSTMFVLATLDRVIEPGDVVLFDEFNQLLDEYRAFIDYQRAFRRNYEVVAATSRAERIAIRLLERTADCSP